MNRERARRRLERRPQWRGVGSGRLDQQVDLPKPKGLSGELRALDFAPPPLGLWHCQPSRDHTRPPPR